MNSRIEINPLICHGKPVIRGTRVMVANILGALGAGDSIETVLADYPGVTKDDVQAALTWAGQLAQFEEIPYDLSKP